MITAGTYSVWFKTPIGEGAGMVELESDGELRGGDSTFAYAGRWKHANERLQATLCARRTLPGPPGVFGLDEIDLTLVGSSNDGSSISCTGFAKQSPALKLEVTMLRLRDGRQR